MKLTPLEDEHLEAIWLISELGVAHEGALKERLKDQYSPEALADLEEKGFLKKAKLSKEGKKYTERLIRAHRLAERLLNDVLGVKEFEVGACEFEHILNREIIDGLCTLLGHPTHCPHGKPIPPGTCCRKKEKTVISAVHSLSSLKPGESLKILYIETENDRELHILEGMRIKPGATIKVHQTKPTMVIENEGTHIALDHSVAHKIQGLFPQD